ncbi:MAG: DinB family protein [Candidatus Eiseniibacteriota bacterium]
MSTALHKPVAIAKPAAGEHIEYFSKYIQLVSGDDARPALARQAGETLRLLEGVSEAQGLHRYQSGKWSVKEVVGHITDTERVFAYRALRFGRGDETPLAGFDENQYVPQANSDLRTMHSLRAELSAVRAATLSLAESFDETALQRSGPANAHPVSVRALFWIIAGHELHHVALLRDRYGLKG